MAKNGDNKSSGDSGNYAWIQHFIHHLSPMGVAGFVMANCSMSTQTSSEWGIRRGSCFLEINPAKAQLELLTCRKN